MLLLLFFFFFRPGATAPTIFGRSFCFTPGGNASDWSNQRRSKAPARVATSAGVATNVFLGHRKIEVYHDKL